MKREPVWILLTFVAACSSAGERARDSLVAASSAASQPKSSTLTPEVRARVEDSVRAFIRRGDIALNRRDVEELVAEQGDSVGMTANGRYAVHTADSVRNGFRYLEHVRSASISQKIRRLDVLAPDAAAITTEFDFATVDSAGKRDSVSGAWTAVVAQRGGRWVSLQEHTSMRPQPARNGTR
jgi:hypothetical protein